MGSAELAPLIDAEIERIARQLRAEAIGEADFSAAIHRIAPADRPTVAAQALRRAALMIERKG